MAYKILFDDVGEERDLEAYTDDAVEQVKNEVEQSLGRKLSVDPRTDFPTFTIYENGEALAGG